MKKEIIVKIVIDGDKIGSIIHKSGFKNDVDSNFEIIGILTKVLLDEQLKLNDKLKIQQNYIFKESMGDIKDNDNDAI